MNNFTMNHSMFTMVVMTSRNRPLDEALAALLLVVSFYMSVSQFIYQGRKRAFKHMCGLEERSMKVMALVDILGFISLLVFALSVQIELRFGSWGNAACASFYYIAVLSANVSILCSYLVLWIRQRAFYTNSNLKHLSSRPLRVLSVLIIVGVFLFRITTMSFNFSITRPRSTIAGCGDFRGGSVQLLRQISLLLLSSSMVSLVFQVGFLALVLFPMCRQFGFRQLASAQNARIRHLVVRLCVSTVICVSSNVAVTLATSFGLRRYGMAFWVIIFGFNLIFCALAEQYSFVDFVSRMFPLCSWDKEDGVKEYKPSGSGSGQTDDEKTRKTREMSIDDL